MNVIGRSYFVLVFLISAVAPVIADDPATPSIPKELIELAGTYKGQWTMFALDEKGEVVKRFAWTDIMKVENPEIKGDRAQVSLSDEMTYEGGKIPPRKSTGKEGYFLKKDGSLGEYFIEMNGQVTKMVQIGENVWIYSVSASPQELKSMGYPSGATGQHVLVKVILKEGGKVSHRISRVSTITWKGTEGKEQTKQFVSLQGFHQKL